MEEPTRHQIQTLMECYDKNSFVCPVCKSCGGQHPSIENPGENQTQIYCTYGCGYIYIEDHLNTRSPI